MIQRWPIGNMRPDKVRRLSLSDELERYMEDRFDAQDLKDILNGKGAFNVQN